MARIFSSVRLSHETLFLLSGVILAAGIIAAGILGVSFLVRITYTALEDEGPQTEAARHFDREGLVEIGVLPPRQ